ncbi:MAG: hypothetical protein GY774_13645 [Planctomycetes bacterium]|nr:hypothetical protein [Planctomycetota bacterium]
MRKLYSPTKRDTQEGLKEGYHCPSPSYFDGKICIDDNKGVCFEPITAPPARSNLSLPTSGIQSSSFYDATPSFRTQLQLNTPTALSSSSLAGSQLGFNPYAAPGLGGIGSASNISSPLLNGWPMYNPSQNLSTFGSGANTTSFRGIGGGFSR